MTSKFPVLLVKFSAVIAEPLSGYTGKRGSMEWLLYALGMVRRLTEQTKGGHGSQADIQTGEYIHC